MKLLALLLLFAGQVVRASLSRRSPMRLVVGFAPGGAADFVARTLQEPLQRALGQPIVVDNRPGAGSSIAAEHVAKSARRRLHRADREPVEHPGESAALARATGFEPLKDLVPVSKVTSSPLVVAVNPASA